MLIIFDALMALMIYFDKKQFKTFFTPFSLIASVYLVLINLNNLIISDIYGYYKVNARSLCILCLIFFLIFCISVFFGFLYQKMRSSKIKFQLKNRMSFKTIKFIFLIGLLAYTLSMIINIRNYGFGGIKGQNNGILGHLTFFGFIISPILLDKASTVKKNKLLYYLAVIAMFVISVLFGGKYVICINFLYLFVYYIVTKNPPLKKIIKISFFIVVGGVLLFLLIYCVFPLITGVYGQSTNLLSSVSFAIEHFFYYLLSPIIANNYVLSHSTPNGLQIALTVPINIVNKLIGVDNYVSPIYPADFEYAQGSFTNVAGILGEVYYCLGGIGCLIYLFVLFSIIYTLYLSFKISGKYKLTVSYVLGVLVFSFFCNFFTVSGVVLPIIYTFILESYFQLIRRKNVKKGIGVNHIELERNR